MLTRRQLLRALPGSIVALGGVPMAFAEKPEKTLLARALEESDLVYITPLKPNGEESRCHAEVWFVHQNNDLFVVTSTERWRAEAVRRGLNKARLWVGDHGEWTRSKGTFRQAPQVDASVTLENDEQLAQQLLKQFGQKYPLGWIVYGSRFRKGLANGSRVLLRYSLAS